MSALTYKDYCEFCLHHARHHSDPRRLNWHPLRRRFKFSCKNCEACDHKSSVADARAPKDT